MKKIICILSGLILGGLLLNSCMTAQEYSATITIDQGEIPSGMKSENFGLIGILIGVKFQDKRTQKMFMNHYSGKYTLVRANMLSTREEMLDKCSGLEQYRYFMHYDIEVSYPVPGDATAATTYRYYLYDRKIGKVYSRKTRSSFPGLEMKAYLMAIDRVRRSY